MKSLSNFFIWALLFMFSSTSVFAEASVPSAKTTVIYFGQLAHEDFQAKVKPVFDQESCKTCEILNFTPYLKSGEVDIDTLKERVESLPENTSFVFFDYNMKLSESNKDLVEALNRKVEKGLVVVASAGAPRSSEASSPLSRTVLGRVKNALIIGELGEKDRLNPTSFYGPEMLTAIRPPKDKIGQGYSPLIFAANLAERWQKRSAAEWSEYLKMKKASTRKLWLDLGDIF